MLSIWEALMKSVSIVGIAQLPVKKSYARNLRQLGAEVVRLAMKDAGTDRVDALYASNMLSDELQCQKHIAALIADEADLDGVEALQIRAATASGAAALRVAFLAVASGLVEVAIAVGVEKMSEGAATQALAKALDAQSELPDGASLISQNAALMWHYFRHYRPPKDALAHFSVNAHRNAQNNPNALFREAKYTTVDVLNSRTILPPIHLLDCAPICDGAAAVVLVASDNAHNYCEHPIRILASTAATDRFRAFDRQNPLHLGAAQLSSEKAFQHANLHAGDMSFLELHDAFSIMACLALEANGFAPAGTGWQLAAEGEIGIGGRIPVCTMGGLKARGHPVGATALYQVCEIVLQLTGRAGSNQVSNAQFALMQSIGGIATTVISHIFGA
jgi:acetyl-CoA C-acetyltransferase